jgi:hypothetical protein
MRVAKTLLLLVTMAFALGISAFSHQAIACKQSALVEEEGCKAGP